MYEGHKVAAVVALGRNRELGKGNRLIWKIPADVQRFRDLTRGHPLIMGRKTFESILSYRGSPLPERINIVITRNNDLRGRYSRYSDVVTVSSLPEALEVAKESRGGEEIHIGGGAELYKEALPLIDKLYLTLIDAEAPEADTFFPSYEKEFTKQVFEEEHEWEGIKYRYVDLERV
ncbi:dihydrofolate reductase [Candidatus Kaiserbacteria bacterium]|nr:dihydrofolate reductase [Candidatus Kaiserbacteria bacterium]